ncbi:MAG: putative transcriptional regulator, PucR family [Pseudonocardiales bacterium]|nr:putative transcriptional regulator, PucR family [Pseudonocardiales bacterium]
MGSPGSVTDATVRRIEQSSGALATQAVGQMDETMAWFRALPADQRSWVTLVAQAGIAGFVEWMRSPNNVSRLASDVFGAAPLELTRSVTLRQTVEMVRVMISVVEERIPLLADPDQQGAVRDSILRFSREIAFAAARVYAGAAESRGAWDARLEALVIDGLVRGAESAESSPSSQAAALGWRHTGPITAVVGRAPERDTAATLGAVHLGARRAGIDCIAGVHAGRLVVVLGGVNDPGAGAQIVLAEFGAGPVVYGPLATDVAQAGAVTLAALSGLAVTAAWPQAPRPGSAEELLPERALAGEPAARRQVIEQVYAPLAAAPSLLETVSTYLEGGGSLEATGRALFVHTNTVRYRLRRAADVCGHSPTDPRGAFLLRVALTLGRLA